MECVADGRHIRKAGFEIIALFHNRAPCRPNAGLFAAARKYPAERVHVFLVQRTVKRLIHVVGVRRTLRVDVEHDKRVKPVKKRNALYGFQCVVEVIRLRRRGVDADGNERLFAGGTQYVTVFGVKIRDIKPFFAVVNGAFFAVLLRFFKCQNFGVLRVAFRNVHVGLLLSQIVVF